MGFTYDIATSVGRVRLLATDNRADRVIFDDGEIDVFLELEGDVRRAAAMALETIASQETLLLKYLSVSNLSTNGPAVAEALRESAKRLREQAEESEAREGGSWDYAELAQEPFGVRERLWNELLRNTP